MRSGPKFGRMESIVDALRDELLQQIIWEEDRVDIYREHAFCLAMIAGGETDAQAKQKSLNTFWQAWHKYLVTRFPFDATLKEKTLEDVKKYMESRWDDRPLVVTAIPQPRRRHVGPIVQEMSKRKVRRHPRGPGGWRRS